MRLSLLIPSLALGLAACSLGPVLVPDTGAVRAPGTRTGAVTQSNGVRVTVDGSAWQSTPVDLTDALTPVLVTIENNSNFPLRVSYQVFALVGSTGFRYVALPPLQVQGQLPISERSTAPGVVLVAATAPIRVAPLGFPPAPGPAPAVAAPAPRPAPVRERPARVTEPRFHHRGFYVAPRFGGLYPDIAVWPYFYPYDGTYYDRFYGEWPEQLPTSDMVNEALPEGVVDAGGSISGFVFFQKVSNRESRVRFDMKLVDADGGRAVGDAVVPFAVVE